MIVCGGLGAAARFVVDGGIRRRASTSLPIGTLVINVVGSFALGLLAGLSRYHRASGDVVLVLGTGFCGGFTTFSTASVQTVRLIQQRPGAGIGFTAGMLLGCVAAAWGGLALGRVI